MDSPASRPLQIDFETRSEIDLKEAGLSNYVLHPSTRVLMIAWAFGDDPVQVADLSDNEMLPEEVLSALREGHGPVVAWNTAFEEAILRARFRIQIEPRRWVDPMQDARFATLPGSLGAVAKLLKVETPKDEEGKRLIRKFSVPTKATKKDLAAGLPAHFFRDRNTDPEDWALFLSYCRQDVECQRATLKRLAEKFPSRSAFEYEVERIDREINSLGIPVDLQFVRQARDLMTKADAQTLDQLRRITGVENPNSVAQLKAWLATQGCPMESLDAETVERVLALSGLPEEVRSVLTLRSKQSGAGPKKLDAILAQVSSDGRLRHQLTYYGVRTGRWSGRGVQPQNLPRPSPGLDIEAITEAIRTGAPLTRRH